MTEATFSSLSVLRPGLWAALAALALLPVAARADLAGNYVGNFNCSDPFNRAELQIETKGSRRGSVGVSAILTLYFSSKSIGIPKTRVELKGMYVEGTGNLGLSAKKWLGPVPKGWDRLALTAGYKADRITGHTGFTRCDFVFVRAGTEQAAQFEANLARGIERQAVKERRKSAPPEWRDTESEISGGQVLEYVDARLTPAGWSNLEVEPIDEAHEKIRHAGMKCIATSIVRWRGTQGTAPANHFSTKWHVIECRGNCKGLRYEIDARVGLLTHYGITTAVPVILIRSPMDNLTWHFTKPIEQGPPPEVRVHTWTKTFGDSGPGCELY